eukprot:3061735-Rhodomonas_salina.2
MDQQAWERQFAQQQQQFAASPAHQQFAGAAGQQFPNFPGMMGGNAAAGGAQAAASFGLPANLAQQVGSVFPSVPAFAALTEFFDNTSFRA